VIRSLIRHCQNPWDFTSVVHLGRAVAQSSIRRFPAAEARIEVLVMSCKICSGQSGTGAGFLRVLQFPLPNICPLIARQSSTFIIQCWYSRPIIDRSNSGLGSTPAPKINKNSSFLWTCFYISPGSMKISPVCCAKRTAISIRGSRVFGVHISIVRSFLLRYKTYFTDDWRPWGLRRADHATPFYP
jgi:hypothetical protein